MTRSNVNKKINVEFSQKINSSKNNLWKVIAEPGNLNNFHPFCKQNSVVVWNKENSKDSIEYYNGNTLNRKFTHWNEGSGYELIIKKKTQHFLTSFGKSKKLKTKNVKFQFN